MSNLVAKKIYIWYISAFFRVVQIAPTHVNDEKRQYIMYESQSERKAAEVFKITHLQSL